MLILSCQSNNKSAVKHSHPLEEKKSIVDSFVYDEMGLLSIEQQKHLSNKLKAYYYKSSIAILCMTTKTIKPFDDEMDYGDFN